MMVVKLFLVQPVQQVVFFYHLLIRGMDFIVREQMVLTNMFMSWQRQSTLHFIVILKRVPAN